MDAGPSSSACEEVVLDSVELSESESETLLRAGVTGRVAVSTPRGPHIVPVNYSVVGDLVVLRTSPYSVVGTHAHGTTVAFEADAFDHSRQRGWSVLVRGLAEVVTDPRTLDRIRREWPPRPWVGGSRSLHIGIRIDEISGRRLGHGWNALADLPGRRVV
jgi:nitroimidazol reductase NimA-like FMN-containing flavoprotein (pyridoxamine 5'-phosphate oxidase superfamily)